MPDNLAVIGALGLVKGRTPAYVEAVVFDSEGRRWALGKEGYGHPEDFDVNDIVMIQFPGTFRADHKKHALLIGPDELSMLSAWMDPPELVSEFMSWVRGPRDFDDSLCACRLEEDYAAWMALPEQSEVILLYLCDEIVKKSGNASDIELERLAWKLQRCARGDLRYMVHASLAFQKCGKADFSRLMRERACTATDAAWEEAMNKETSSHVEVA